MILVYMFAAIGALCTVIASVMLTCVLLDWFTERALDEALHKHICIYCDQEW